MPVCASRVKLLAACDRMNRARPGTCLHVVWCIRWWCGLHNPAPTVCLRGDCRLPARVAVAGRLHEARPEYRCLAAATDDFDILLQLRQGQPFGRQRVGMRSALLRPIAQGDNGCHERYRKRGARLQALALVGKRGPHVDARRGDINVTAAVRIAWHQVAIDSGNGNHLFVCCGITRQLSWPSLPAAARMTVPVLASSLIASWTRSSGGPAKLRFAMSTPAPFSQLSAFSMVTVSDMALPLRSAKKASPNRKVASGTSPGVELRGLPASREKTPVP